MSAYTEVVSLHTEDDRSLVAEDDRWRQWQIRGRLQDRRSAMHARIFAAVMFSGLLGWLAVQLFSRP
jgi:hypothetical protein